MQGCDLERRLRRENGVYSVWTPPTGRRRPRPFMFRWNMHKHTAVAFSQRLDECTKECRRRRVHAIYRHTRGSHGFSAVALETPYKHSCFVFSYLSSTYRVNRCIFIERSDVSLWRERLGLIRHPSPWKRLTCDAENFTAAL